MARIRDIDPDEIDRRARDAIKVELPKRSRGGGWMLAIVLALIVVAAVGVVLYGGAIAEAIAMTQGALSGA